MQCRIPSYDYQQTPNRYETFWTDPLFKEDLWKDPLFTRLLFLCPFALLSGSLHRIYPPNPYTKFLNSGNLIFHFQFFLCVFWLFPSHGILFFLDQCALKFLSGYQLESFFLRVFFYSISYPFHVPLTNCFSYFGFMIHVNSN